MPDLSPSQFNAVQWSFNTIAIVLVGARITIRLTKLSRLMADDYLIIAALILLLVTGAVYDQEFKAQASQLYSFNVLTDAATVQLRYDLVGNILFTTVLWLIKLSFLMLYRRLMGTLQIYQILWWTIVSFLASTYVASVIVFSLICPNVSQVSCYAGTRKHVMSIASYALNTTADIASDLMILAFAINLVRNVRIDAKQKILLIGLFSLTGFVIAVAILRVVVTYADPKYQIQSPLWIYLWTMIEMATAVIVAALLSFRLLFTGGKTEKGRPKKRITEGGKRTQIRRLVRRLALIIGLKLVDHGAAEDAECMDNRIVEKWEKSAKPLDPESNASSHTRAETATTDPSTLIGSGTDHSNYAANTSRSSNTARETSVADATIASSENILTGSRSSELSSPIPSDGGPPFSPKRLFGQYRHSQRRGNRPPPSDRHQNDPIESNQMATHQQLSPVISAVSPVISDASDRASILNSDTDVSLLTPTASAFAPTDHHPPPLPFPLHPAHLSLTPSSIYPPEPLSPHSPISSQRRRTVESVSLLPSPIFPIQTHSPVLPQNHFTVSAQASVRSSSLGAPQNGGYRRFYSFNSRVQDRGSPSRGLGSTVGARKPLPPIPSRSAEPLRSAPQETISSQDPYAQYRGRGGPSGAGVARGQEQRPPLAALQGGPLDPYRLPPLLPPLRAVRDSSAGYGARDGEEDGRGGEGEEFVVGRRNYFSLESLDLRRFGLGCSGGDGEER